MPPGDGTEDRSPPAHSHHDSAALTRGRSQAACRQVAQLQSAHEQLAQASSQCSHEQVAWLQVAHEQSAQSQVAQRSEQSAQVHVAHSS